MITDIYTLDLNKSYTYADYLNWQFKERLELIKGRIFKMSPAPARQHQDITGAPFFGNKTISKKEGLQSVLCTFRCTISESG